MENKQTRRRFLLTSGLSALTAGVALGGLGGCSIISGQTPPPTGFKISLAEWSLHRRLFGVKRWSDMFDRFSSAEQFKSTLVNSPGEILKGKLDHLDFARTAKREFGIDAVEYVNVFFFGKAQDTAYLNEMKRRANDEGVVSRLIMCDFEGDLGDSDSQGRTRAVQNHYKWVEAAALLGCTAIRVNARSQGSREEQRKLAADGLRRLAEFSEGFGIDVLVENHGGISSDGKWLSSVMQTAAHPNLGTLPDFGNFKIDENTFYDNYQGVDELMPMARAVSAKSFDFDASGAETTLDYRRLMKLVLGHGYHDYVGIEYEGERLSEADGIAATKKLLEKIRDSHSRAVI